MSSWKDAETKPEPAKEAAPKLPPGQGLQEGVPKTEDAVLYKPHHSAKEFSRINTHKNENLTENVLVPDWQTCLRLQQHTGHASTSLHLHGGTGFSAAHAFDIRHWKWYLSSISSRLGLTLPTSHKTRPHSGGSSSSTGDSESDLGGELRFLQEQTYQLYGKSLSRLPSHKRACLPNHSKYFTGPQQDLQATSTKRRKTQLDGDAEGENPVTITNDDDGNLLINDSKPVGPKYAASILPRKFGPLRKISKILIIGVHGFFPTRMIRPLIGAPKGTSSKFANEAEKAVIRYLVENDMMGDKDNRDVSIQKIALEKEGKIFDRVEFFLQILTKWEDELNEADFVFIAAHSQGCVVSIILLARLIKMGILKHASYMRIGVLGMAGVNNGPFYGTDKSLFMKAYSAIEHESMIELFELTKFDSPQSLAYKDAMQTIVSTNVKICLVGSINDQLVPLYSALASHVYHPNIYRACYIDSSAKTPAFIKTLISICCQLQNMGYFDNNVIKEISSILAGPLTGGGHSKIYNDGKVYDLGVKFMLDTDDLVIPHQADSTEKPGAYDSHVDVPYTNRVFVREYNVGKIGTNPFILPWCLRGLIFNIQKNWGAGESQRTAHGKGHKTAVEEVSELYALFDEWRPETKPLKDLKFRLSGIRASKL
ncbi:hypothetical protein METBIDRAFT_38897 [Metschnikowia bicuspidata var. bicuspidata NRRL YB-4993]|uniref:YMC020W-like alpha/beta hydrolase domain-containing protein n=1 Tax=Metschnikowia bicuspidata var. bicuspidata NRRL YB-4993 TaxID=869754 RepID=A0A1A0HEC0_9ASCO|nr:hypothetical protein METBIDRAFT_38897 [Metschnikowia bicuspidata var. bicuspidata NRRL YB-4993]OBA22459.1 hypothetical protein METBIDRAFT_38897 [Metschnikowia bicuspidata var. bicuspidata NRRL YB-4993]